LRPGFASAIDNNWRWSVVTAWIDDFKKFLMQGNLVMLAVAFVIATVFAAVVKALIADIVTPIIGLIFGKPNFEDLSFTINSSHFLYGDFINAVFTFVTTAAAVFFFVVKPYESVQARRSRGADPDLKECPECTTEIPYKARRCPACTAQIGTT
jgi:large conductance mechanosensitive channel